jgi:hypothetical protein
MGVEYAERTPCPRHPVISLPSAKPDSRRAARDQGRLLPDSAAAPAGWCAADRFAAVLETAALHEAELGDSCRQRGLYPEQAHSWRSACG